MKRILNNIELIIVVAVIALRAIIALPLTFAAVKHFAFLGTEGHWLVTLVAYVSIFAVEAIMTIFSFLSANFRKAKLDVAYRVAIAFVGVFFVLNAVLLWEIKAVYAGVGYTSLAVWQVLNLASVALAESLGFMNSERVQRSVVIQEAAGRIPANVAAIKSGDMPLADKIRSIWALGFFKTQAELAGYLVTTSATVSRSLNQGGK